MKGNYFLEINPETGALMSQGKILNRVDDSHWLCMFAGQVPYKQVVPTQNMRLMNIFDNKDHMDAWIKANSTPPAAPKDKDIDPSKPANGEAENGESQTIGEALDELEAGVAADEAALDATEAGLDPEPGHA